MTEFKGPPSDFELSTRGGMTNFDLTITPGLKDLLQSGKWYVYHAAWEFQGRVWFEDGAFHEQVWRFHVPIGYATAPSLSELMENVNDQYGWE